MDFPLFFVISFNTFIFFCQRDLKCVKEGILIEDYFPGLSGEYNSVWDLILSDAHSFLLGRSFYSSNDLNGWIRFALDEIENPD